jgi:ankyrin repeat protein
LHHASFQGHAQTAEQLVNAGADIKVENCVGEAPLRCAVFSNSLDIIKFLHQRGAALTLRDRWGSTAPLNAVLFNTDDVLRYLLSLGLKCYSKIF